jgi:hypothetical protein
MGFKSTDKKQQVNVSSQTPAGASRGGLVFRRFRKNVLIASCLFVRSHGTAGISLEGFSLNLVFEDFSDICRENSSLIKN